MVSDTGWMIGAFAVGLALTLVLAAFLTPAHWWRRPNLRALAILAAGTWGIGSLLLGLAPVPALATASSATEGVQAIRPAAPTMGRSFHVYEDLNLRAGSGTSARRVAVVPAGATLTATGARDGDWWEVSGTVRGKQVSGWVSSLWLRRADERRG
jgi:MFS family permease